MTITTETARSQYLGNGSTDEFTIGFEFLAPEDVKVILTDADGVDATWVQGTQYNVRNNDGTPIVGRVQPATGKVVVVTAPTDYTPATDTVLTLLRNQALKQTASYTENGPFPARAHERALDRLSMQIQKEAEKLGRAPKFKETSQTADVTFPEPNAGKIIGWNADGDDLENKALTDLEDGLYEVVDEDDMASNSDTKVPTQQSAKAYVDGKIIDEDNMASNLDTKVPTQQSVKAYVDAAINAIKNGVAAAGDTLAELYTLITNHTSNTSNPHSVTASQVGLGTSSNPQFATVELGNASDTTLSRGAAGFLAVEGKRVPSPASQAAGDLIYRGSSEWERLAKGTAGQVLKMNAGATAPEWGSGSGGATIGTAVTPPATTSFDYTTPITANTKLIFVDVSALSLATNGVIIVQLGDSGGIETGGYAGAVNEPGTGTTNLSDGFILGRENGAANIIHGILVLALIDAATNLWAAMGIMNRSSAAFGNNVSGTKALTGTLTTVRVTTQAGSANFDNSGKVNVTCVDG